jgi:hypothetical protein
MSKIAHDYNNGDPVPIFICHMCYQCSCLYKHQKLPDRQGTVDGKTASERHHDLVNEACKEPLNDKRAYGLENGIRCERWQAHRYAYREEWRLDTAQPPYDPVAVRRITGFDESRHTVPVCASLDCPHPDLEM